MNIFYTADIFSAQKGGASITAQKMCTMANRQQYGMAEMIELHSR
jgi:hypothetical protein